MCSLNVQPKQRPVLISRYASALASHNRRASLLRRRCRERVHSLWRRIQVLISISSNSVRDSKYLERVDQVVMRLTSLGHDVPELDETLAITRGIPEAYKQLARALEYGNPDKYTAPYLK